MFQYLAIEAIGVFRKNSSDFLKIPAKANMGGDPAPAARRLENDYGAEIFCIGVGTNVDSKTLDAIATKTTLEEHRFLFQDFANINDLANQMMTNKVGAF